MAEFHVWYNPLAGKTSEKSVTDELTAHMKDDELTFTDMTAIEDFTAELNAMPKDACVMLVGGDGTINRFINAVEKSPRPVYYYAAGNGNDFWNDLGFKRGDKPICIDRYLENLPTVTVNGNKYKFINGVGYGIDGYCCEKGDDLRAKGKIPNYTKIAVSGLLFHYKPKFATVTVDGKEYSFKKVWIAPTMNGRFYGGGMIPTPDQDRMNAARTVSLCLMFGAGKLPTLMLFPSIFKGEHVKKVKNVQVLTGNTITVKFAKPSPLQIDGETIRNVSEYTVTSTAVAESVMDEAAATENN